MSPSLKHNPWFFAFMLVPLALVGAVLWSFCPSTGYVPRPTSSVVTPLAPTLSVASPTVSTTAPADINRAYTLINQQKILDKYVKTPDGNYWIGLKQKKGKDEITATYELWRFQPATANIALARTFDLTECSGIEWEPQSDSGARIAYYTSPCEAQATTETTYLDRTGSSELLKATHTNPSGELVFQESGHPEITVSLVVDGVCTGGVEDERQPLPEVFFKGVKLQSINNDEQKIIPLSKPVEVSCEEGYGGAILPPLITDPKVTMEKIEFGLPNGQTAIFDLTQEYKTWPPLSF